MSEQVKTTKAYCYWCHGHCKVEVHVRNGKLEKIEEVKGEPRSKRLYSVVRACPRARAAAEYFYHPDRLTLPLKRIGEKGEGKWQKISWDEALAEIAVRLKELKERYGAETIATTVGTGRTNDEYRVRFMNLLGSPNIVGQGNICYGPNGMVGLTVLGWWTGYAGLAKPLGRGTKCIVLWGANPEQANRRMWASVLDRKREGAKLIVVDPRRVGGADRADIWLQPRPGTDVALMMAMIKVIIDEGLYDKEFVERWCYGFDKLQQRIQDYPLEKVAEITWVPAEKIAEAARWCAAKPSVIYHSMGAEQSVNTIEFNHAHIILAAITGNLDIRGGDSMIGYPQQPNFRHAYEIELDDKLPPKQRGKQIGAGRFRLQSIVGYDLVKEYAVTPWTREVIGMAHAPSLYRAIVTGEPYPVKALITVSSNPMVTQANTKLVYKALKSLDLYVVHDFWMTPSAELADYVLPAASWLERPQLNGLPIDAGEAAMPAQVEGQYDRRPDYNVWRGLGVRLGQQEYWPWESLEEAFNYKLQPSGYKTLKEFMEKTGGYLELAGEEKKYERLGFGTPTGKVELYSTIMEKLGYDPLPRYNDPPESPASPPELVKEFPLILITGGRHQPFYHSEHRQIESLRNQHPDPIIQINPETASKLGISDGDWVWIETLRGRVRQKCKYFDGIAPGVVHAQHGWWFPEEPGEEPWLHGVWESNINVVIDDEPEHCNKMNGGWPLRTALCKVYKVKSY